MADWDWSSEKSSRSLGRGTGVRAGNPGVFYDDQGRLFYKNDQTLRQDDQYTSTSLPKKAPWRQEMRPDDTLTYDPRKTNSNPRSHHFSRSTTDTPRSSGRSIITKHYNGYKNSPHMDYRGGHRDLIPVRPPVVTNGYYRDGGKYIREGSIIVEERIVSHERPWIWPLFLIAGFLMFATGILNLLFCVDFHIYSLLWVPIFVVIFAIFGAVHKGIYRGSGGKWRNWGYIVMGILTTFVVFVCCAFVLMRLNHVTIQITELESDGFIAFEKSRMARFNEYPRVNLTDQLDTNIWACYSLDWVALILLLVCFIVLASTLIVANNFYNSNHDYRREVDPFCRPALFNPFGQTILGQVSAFLGMIVKTATHGNFQIRWQDYWISVWIAIFPMIAGVATAFALKRVGLRHGRGLVIVGLILQIISVLVTIVGIGLYLYSMYENILSLEPGPIAITDYSKALLTASIIMFVIMVTLLLVNLVYSIALIIRLAIEGCRRDNDNKEKRYYAEERYAERYPDKDRYEDRNGVRVFREDGESRY